MEEFTVKFNSIRTIKDNLEAWGFLVFFQFVLYPYYLFIKVKMVTDWLKPEQHRGFESPMFPSSSLHARV